MTIAETLFKNELGDWPHQYMAIEGYFLFGIPLIAGLIDGGIVGGLIWGMPFIIIMLLQRFIPI